MTNMTEEEINKAVAAGIGYEEIGPHPSYNFIAGFRPGTRSRHHHDRVGIPNFAGSLDACAEFERRLTDEQFEIYDEHLMLIWERDHFEPGEINRWSCSVPLARCEAYLRTINTETR